MAPPTNGTSTVPTLPPLMCALMAKPRRSCGKASERSALPTGCCGLAPMRAALIGGEELGDRLRQAADEEAGPEDELAAGEERRARDVAGQEAVGELHRAADRGGDGDERADVALVEPVLDDHDRIHERHERRLGVDGGMRDGEQGQRQTRPRWTATIHRDAPQHHPSPLRRRPRKGHDRGRATASLEASLIGTVAPLMRHLVAHARRRRAWSELTYQQYNVLRMIDTLGPQPQAEVARRLMVTAPVVTRLASTLADAGLVARRHRSERQARGGAGADRRPVASGRAPCAATCSQAAHELLEPIPEERRASVAAALEELQVLLPTHSARR